MMMKKQIILTFSLFTLGLGACQAQYEVTGIERSRILVDQRYDATPDKKATQFLTPYKQEVDKSRKPIVGQLAQYMSAAKPESLLSNLLSDILIYSSVKFNEKPDFSVYNVGGMRAAMAQGDVTLGTILDVAPFENKICFLTLTGEKTLELMHQIASRMGEGVSHGVKMQITSDGKLVSATINGEPISKDRTYRIATLDYLAEGNDRLYAFKSKTDVVAPQDPKYNLREIIANYFRERTRKGEVVDSKMEGRIVIVDDKGQEIAVGN